MLLEGQQSQESQHRTSLLFPPQCKVITPLRCLRQGYKHPRPWPWVQLTGQREPWELAGCHVIVAVSQVSDLINKSYRLSSYI